MKTSYRSIAEKASGNFVPAHSQERQCRWPWLINIVLMLLTLSQLFAQSLHSERQVIHRNQIEISGLTRLSDIFTLIDDWQVSSVEGFVWDATANGLSTLQGQDWIILLNGQRMAVDLLDINNINMLPLSVDQLDSVVVFSFPQLHYGEVTDRGLIHLFSQPPKTGIHYSAREWLGNESGDPGPFIFTRYRSENKDRLGPEHAHHLRLGAGNWSVQGDLKYHNHYSTDARILRRNPGRNNQFMWLQMRSLGFRAVYREKDEQHELFVGHTTSGDFLGDDGPGADPLFFRPLLREIPAKRIFSHAGLTGNIILTPRASLRYQFHYSAATLDSNIASKEPERLNWENKQIYANVESLFDAGTYRIVVGAGWLRMNAETGYELTNDKYPLTKVYAQLDRHGAKRWQRSMTFQWLSGELQSSIKLVFNNRWQPSSRHKFWLNLAYSERLLAEDNSFWFWHNRGYRILADNGVDDQLIGDFGKSNLGTADVGWLMDIGDNYQLQLSGLLRLAGNQYLDERSFESDDFGNVIQGNTILYAGVSGQNAGANLRIRHRPAKRFGHQFSLQFLKAIGGDGIYQRNFESLATWRGAYRATLNIVESFGLWGTLHMESGRHWSEFSALAGPGQGYQDDTEGFWSADIAAQKWFWKRRFRAHILCRNLFDRKIYYHPLGADFGLSFYLQLSMAIGYPGDR